MYISSSQGFTSIHSIYLFETLQKILTVQIHSFSKCDISQIELLKKSKTGHGTVFSVSKNENLGLGRPLNLFSDAFCLYYSLTRLNTSAYNPFEQNIQNANLIYSHCNEGNIASPLRPVISQVTNSLWLNKVRHMTIYITDRKIIYLTAILQQKLVLVGKYAFQNEV